MKKIEELTGLRFLADLPADERAAVEQNASVHLWPVN
jgi:hypothetical protein